MVYHVDNGLNDERANTCPDFEMLEFPNEHVTDCLNDEEFAALFAHL